MRGGDALPSGTVTFLFTDIERSTQTVEAMGNEAYADALDLHKQLLRDAFENHGGHEVGTEGDAFFVAFERAHDALAAAVDGQQALDGHALRVRMGMHTGEALVRESDYVGHDVHKAKRISDAGHGGQILLSETTADLVGSHARLVDLGPHRLKDLGEPQRIFQVGTDEFPRLRSIESFSTNLPLYRSAFIGREHEIATVRKLLDSHRLVTLTGIGGCGKTRLAIHVGAEVLDEYPDGVFLVELGPLADPALIAQAIGAAVAPARAARDVAGGVPATTTFDALIEALVDRTCLIVVDNCEHLLDATADAVDRIQRNCPGVAILATSREGLGVEGEQSFRVPSMGLPKDDAVNSDAVSLFVSRAKGAAPGFELTSNNAGTIADICRRLDGIPLAIEFAAARVSHLSPKQISQKLDDRFRLLTGGGRRVQRQRTLQAALDWSYELLSEAERVLLRRLAVFPDDLSLEAAEGVCSDESLEASSITDLLGSLVAKSLVGAEVVDDELRYRLLETVRAYAADRLAAEGEAESFRTRHRDWYLAWIESIPREDLFFDLDVVLRLMPEAPNLREALAWSVAEERPDLVGRIVARTHTRTSPSEIIVDRLRWSRFALEADAELRPDDRLILHGAAVSVGALFEDLASPVPELPRDVVEAASVGWQAWAGAERGAYAGFVAALTRDGDLARRAFSEFEEAIRLAGDAREEWVAYVLAQRGMVEMGLGRVRESADSFAKSALRFRAAGNSDFAKFPDFYLAVAAHVLGDHETAKHSWVSYAELFESHRGFDWDLYALWGNAIYVALVGAYESVASAWSFLEGRLTRAIRAGRQSRIDLVLSAAILHTLEGDHPRAAVLLSCVRERTLATATVLLSPAHYALYFHYRDIVRQSLGHEEARLARDRGAGLSLKEAVELAFADKAML